MDFQAIVNKLTDLAQTGVNKGRDLAEIGKLKLANVSEEDAMRKAFIEIGKLCYEKGCTCDGADLTALYAKVAAAKEKIAYNDEKISDIKAAANIADADIDNLIHDDIIPEDTTVVDDDAPKAE